jgi:hypothetical protein
MFERLAAAFTWRPIPNCPGRFVLAGTAANLSPRTLVGPEVELHEFNVPAARDTVVVARFGHDGGLISYKRANGTFVHTLNDADGFARKLAQLGIMEPCRRGSKTTT